MVRLKALGSLLLLIWSSLAGAGGWSGNGGGQAKVKDNVWFLGEQEVPYCLEVAPDYPVERAVLQPLVAEVIDEWRQFFAKYGLSRWRSFRGKERLPFSLKELPPVSLNFTETTCPQSAATGYTPHEMIHLTFGVDNKIITAMKSTDEEGAYGMALRRAYNHKTFRNGGYLWVSNFSVQLSHIKHLLLHEWGHILGMPHDSTFVMSNEMERLFKNEIVNASLLGQIESPYWPFRLLKGQSANLAAIKGLRHKASLMSPGPCTGLQAVLAAKIPAVFRAAFEEFPASDCVSLFLTKRESGPEQEIYTLELINQNGRVATASGVFRPLSHKKPSWLGPGLFTQWNAGALAGDESVDSTKEVWAYRPVDPTPAFKSLHGMFQFGQKRFPAHISWDRGPILDIFSYPKGSWMTLFTRLSSEEEAAGF